MKARVMGRTIGVVRHWEFHEFSRNCVRLSDNIEDPVLYFHVKMTFFVYVSELHFLLFNFILNKYCYIVIPLES